MELEKNGNSLTVRLIGEVNGENSPKIVEKLFVATDGIDTLTFDLRELEYISSAGLRMLIAMQKLMKEKMTVTNVTDDIMEIFTVTGFRKILNIV